jgi:hypothetical protein
VRRVAFKIAMGACVVQACTAFGTSGTQQGTPDAGPVPPDASTIDVSNDGASPGDGSAPDSPIITVPLCTTPHWLCDDFDSPDAASHGWTPAAPMGDASLAITADPTAPSQPNTIVFSAGPDSQAVVIKNDKMAANGLRCDFELFIDEVGDEEPILFELEVDGPGSEYRLDLLTAGTQYYGRFRTAAPPE